MTEYTITIQGKPIKYIWIDLINGQQYKDPFGDYLDSAGMGIIGVNYHGDLIESRADIALGVFKTRQNYENFLQNIPFNQFRAMHQLQFSSNSTSNTIPFSVYNLMNHSDGWAFGIEITLPFWDVIEMLPNPEIPSEQIKDRWKLS